MPNGRQLRADASPGRVGKNEARLRARLPLLSRPPGTTPINLTPQQAHELEIDAELARHEASLRQ